MSSFHVLVAEDDTNIRTGLVDTLDSEGYKVTAAENGDRALALFRDRHFDLAILDIMMPGKSGYDVCREIRKLNERIPVIMLTAKSEEIDKVVGLQLGADDYITKPFGVKELLARVAAVLRRSAIAPAKREKADPGPPSFEFGSAVIDTRRFTARLGRKSSELSVREIELLRYFKAHPGEVLKRDELLNEVWGIEYYGTTRTLDQHIARLRKKVESRNAPCIATVHGAGYRYDGR